MYKEIDLNDQSLFESNLSSVAPKDNMTLEEAYEYVMDKVRAVYAWRLSRPKHERIIEANIIMYL